MPELNHQDLSFCVMRLPYNLREALKQKYFEKKIIIAGGFIRCVISQEKINDIDLFTENENMAKTFSGLFPESKHSTLNAITIKTKPTIQIITKWLFTNPIDVVNSFDFTICQACIYYENGQWKSYCSEKFYQDLAAKRLVYTSPNNRIEEAGGSMLRVLKYYQRGFRIPLDSLGKVIARLMASVDRKQLSEDEEARVITGLLRVVDPAIDPTHESHLPIIDNIDLSEQMEDVEEAKTTKLIPIDGPIIT